MAEHDELDFLSASPIPSLGACSSLRLRTTSVIPEFMKNTSKKRTRTVSDSHIPCKKVHMEDKKMNTTAIHRKRDEIEVAAKRWIYRHRQLFNPLLPASKYLVNIEKEHGVGDKGHVVPSRELDEQPKLVTGGSMKDYQLAGLSFLLYMHNNGINCILGDEMGLGKTLQTLSLLAYIKEHEKGPANPHLVICPLSVLSSWENESKRWTPSLRIICYYGSQPEKAKHRQNLLGGSVDIVITTYEAYSTDHTWFKTRHWNYCVLDEGHKIKNSSTNIASNLYNIGSLHRLILTGTPVQNNLGELWGLLHWLLPTLFPPATAHIFHDSFDLSKGSYALPFVDACTQLLATLMLRRTKDIITKDVPQREELTVFIPLTDTQRFWYMSLLTRSPDDCFNTIFGEKMNEDDGGRQIISERLGDVKKSQFVKLMNLLMQLRQVCDHPYLILGAQPEPYYLGEHLVASSSKLIALDKILAEILHKGEQVLVFSQFTGMLDLIEDFMNLRGITYCRLDGNTARPRRTLYIKLFQRENSPFKVFLLSTKAGGLGINLTRASTVILMDSDWNPQNDLQAISRAHRIGQKRVVKVYRLICRGSVEDQMLDRIRRKLFLSAKLMDPDALASSPSSGGMGSSEIMSILRSGSSALAEAGAGIDIITFQQAPIGEILSASKATQTARNAKLKKDIGSGEFVKCEDESYSLVREAEEEERELLKGVAQVQSRLFEGRLINRCKINITSEKEMLRMIGKEWNDTQRSLRQRDENEVAQDIILEVIQAPNAPPKKKIKAKRQWEDWCLNCREGGSLLCCAFCPRVFHSECSNDDINNRNTLVACSQHACIDCSRSTADAGGMLFRCRTCPRAYCEDCLPDNFDCVGDVLPEFALLGHKAKPSAYYVRCASCKEYEKRDEAWARDWREEIAKAEERWRTV